MEMTDTLPPFTSAELADLRAKAKAAGDTAVALAKSGNYIPENIYDAIVFADREFRIAANPETILRIIDMIERRDEQIEKVRQVISAAAILAELGGRPYFKQKCEQVLAA